MKMWTWIGIGIAVIVVASGWTIVPDIRRYLKISSM